MVDGAVQVVAVAAGRTTAVANVLARLPAAPGFAMIVAGLPVDAVVAIRNASVLPVDELGAEPRLLDRDRVIVVPAGCAAVVDDGALRYAAEGDRGLRFAPLRGGPAQFGEAGVIDALLCSVADHAGPAAVGVVLAGRGSAGALGIRRLREVGGLTIAQDVHGDDAELPRAAIATGCIDLVVPLDDIARRLADYHRVLRDHPTKLASSSVAELHDRVREHCAPPSVLVDGNLDVVHLSDHAGRYLQLGGEPTRQLLRLVHPALTLELRAAIEATSPAGCRTRTVRFAVDGALRVVELRVRAVDVPELGRGAVLVEFDELDPVAVTKPPAVEVGLAGAAGESRARVRLRSALASAPVAVLGFDDAQRATWGYSLGRELGDGELDALAMFGTGDAERLRRVVRDVHVTRIARRVELDVLVEGAPRTFDFRVAPDPSGVTAVGFDITPCKDVEAALRDADRRKDEFLATLSHELRNPLAPLQVALDLAQLVDHDPVQRAESLTLMARQVTTLTALVDELLDISRITRGKVVLEREPVELARILEGALEATRPLYQPAHAVHVELPDAALRVHGDMRRLVQVFTNLLTNAVKFTPPGGRITVTVDASLAGDRVAVRVADTGIGIAAEVLPGIFDIFVQGRDPDGRRQGGLGIGLSLVRRLVELHGGAAHAHSDGLGRGSAFTIELPLLEQ